ncbi:MAG: alpha/beta hydrolase, partial [Bdellovibrionales bacterium]|nr:alpha/beta hydrolase [Bdellovibrionales bacterium]
MKFIFLFIILINSAWAINDISECLNPGRTIGTNYERPADIILLVPGTGTRGTILTLGHFGNLGGYFEQIENLFYNNNIEFVTVPADPKGNSSVEERVIKLRKWIRRYGLEGRQVLLVGHSLGGLVARVAARDLTLRGFISGVVTMSSPNKGDYLIDWLQEDGTRNRIIHNIATTVGFEVHKKKFLFQMAVDYAPNYNLLIDQSNLLPPVYSVVTYQTPKQLGTSFLPFALTDEIIKQTMKEANESGGEWKGLTDGFVPAYTQVWGECIGMFNA